MSVSGNLIPIPAQTGLLSPLTPKASPALTARGAAVNDLSAAAPVLAAKLLGAVRPSPAVSLCADFVRRLHRSRAWVGAQFWATFCFILAGVAWAATPAEPVWQASLFSLAPPILAASMLALQAITMRSLTGEDRRRTSLLWGSLALLAWSAVIAAIWALLAWFDQILPLWAAWLGAHAEPQAASFTPWRAERWLEAGAWVLRWIVVPAVAIPGAMGAAQWARLPWRKIGRMLLDWRWWSAVVLAALAGVALPGALFAAEPHGTIVQQVTGLFLQLAGAFVVTVSSWVLLLGWAAVLLCRKAAPSPQRAARQPEPHVLLHTKAA